MFKTSMLQYNIISFLVTDQQNYSKFWTLDQRYHFKTATLSTRSWLRILKKKYVIGT